MNKTVIRKWAEALESGEYMQGYGQLYDGETYCCLGVLCQLHMQETGEVWEEDEDGMHCYLGHANYLPATVANWAGLEMVPSVKYDSKRESLDLLNDNMIGFNEIAISIRETWLNE